MRFLKHVVLPSIGVIFIKVIHLPDWELKSQNKATIYVILVKYLPIHVYIYFPKIQSN